MQNLFNLIKVARTAIADAMRLPSAPIARTLAVIHVLTGCVILGYWIGVFYFDFAPLNPPPCFNVFDSSFPAAELVTALLLFLSGDGLMRLRPGGAVFALSAGGALLFMGLVQGMYLYNEGQAEGIVFSFSGIWAYALAAVIGVITTGVFFFMTRWADLPVRADEPAKGK